MHIQYNSQLLLLLVVFVSNCLSLHKISRRLSVRQELNASDVKNITTDDSVVASNTSARVGIDFSDNRVSNSSIDYKSAKNMKSVIETNLTTVPNVTEVEEHSTTLLTNTSVPSVIVTSSVLSLNSTERVTEEEGIDFTADNNSTKTNYFYDLFRIKSLKEKINELENKLQQLMNKNLFYSIAIPAGIGIAVALVLILLMCCCTRGCPEGNCSGRCCYRMLCCCRSRNRYNNRLKYAKSKHLFGDEKNYLLVNNNESDAEIET